MRYRNTALAAFLLATVSTHAQDVSGIALGSNINDAKEKLKNMDADYKIIEEIYKTGGIADITAKMAKMISLLVQHQTAKSGPSIKKHIMKLAQTPPMNK